MSFDHLKTHVWARGNNGGPGSVTMLVTDHMPLTQQQHAEVDRVFRSHQLRAGASLVGYLTHNATLSDGSRVRITSNNGLHQIIVNPARPKPGGELFQPLWVLVTVQYAIGSDIGASLPTHRDYEARSYLYKLPPSFKAENAELMYAGTGSGYIDTVNSGIPDPPANTESRYTVDSGIGVLRGFVPYGPQALLIAEQRPKDYDGSAEIHTTLKYGSFEASHSYSTSSGGVRVGVVRCLADRQFNYAALDTSIGTVYRRVMLGETVVDETDPDGIDPVVSLTPSLTPYTRREVGNHFQSKNRIFTYHAATPGTSNLHERDYDVWLTITGIPRPIFYNDKLAIGVKSGGPSPVCFSVLDWAGVEKKVIDIAALPEVAADSIFSAAVSTFDTYRRIHDMQHDAPFLGPGDIGSVGTFPLPPHRSEFATTEFYYSGFAYSAGVPSVIVTCIPDQSFPFKVGPG